MKPKIRITKKMIAASVAAKARWKEQQEAKPAPVYPRQTTAIMDFDLASRASSAARHANGRISNWEYPRPSIFPRAIGEYDSIDNGRYSSRCKYTHWTYSPRYTSFGIITLGGRVMLYRRGFTGSLKSRILPAPSGMLWTIDNGLCLVRQSDKMDYHPTCEDLQSPRFASVVREAMARNYAARLAAKQEAKRQARFEARFQRDLATTRVTLHDSRRAGNCIEGSLQFAERKLGLDRGSILAAGHLFTVPAKTLLRIANGKTEQAMRAVRAAWSRETTVCI